MEIKIEIRKANQTVTIDSDNMPEVTQAFVMEYGYRQILNDAHSQHVWKRTKVSEGELQFPYLPADKQDAQPGSKVYDKALEAYHADIMATVNEKLANMQNGVLVSRKSGTGLTSEERAIHALILKDYSNRSGETIKAIKETIADNFESMSDGVLAIANQIASHDEITASEYVESKRAEYLATKEKANSAKLSLSALKA